MENISLTINGKKITCPEGQSVLVVAEEHGIKIPKLCYHHSLKPYGACRLCLVEDEKTGRLMASCVTPATQDMTLVSNSPRILQHRRNIVSLMMAEHPESCVVCNKGNRCHLRMVAAELGIAESRLYPMPNHKPLEQANPFIMRDLSKCILCGKCIRADHELVCAGAIDYSNRGFSSRPATLHELPLEESSCTFCGTCVSICPTGALSAQTEYVGTPEKESTSICGFCGIGCSLELGVTGNRVVDVNPSHLKNSVNDATLCVRGHFAHDFLNSKKRLTKPLIRQDDELTPSSWDDAVSITAQRLQQIKEECGPDSIGFLGSSKCTNEENYLFQKIARTVIGTNNVDNGGYLSGRLLLDLVEQRTDEAGRFNFFAGPLSGLQQAEIIFVLGAEPAQTAPVLDYYLKRSVRQGTPLIVANPKSTDLAAMASVHLHPFHSHTPQKNAVDAFYLELINILSAELIARESANTSFISRFTRGFDDYAAALGRLDLTVAAQKAGLDTTDIQSALEILAEKRITFVVGDGVMLQRYGKETMEALLNLALLTGSIGYKGAGFHILTKENNLVGAWHMGAVPQSLPGRYKIADKTECQTWEKAWNAQIPSSNGLDLLQMMQRAEDGSLKAMYIMGENPLRSLPQPDRIRQVLDKLDFIVVQDILKNETTDLADVILPAAAFSEKTGSFTNMEGMVQCFSPAISPPGDARSDLEILSLIATKMGAPEVSGRCEDIRDEISSTISFFREKDARKHPIWIREKTTDHESVSDKQIQFSSVTTSQEIGLDEHRPYVALFGSLRFHLGSGTRTAHSTRIRSCDVQGEIELCPTDAEQLGLTENDRIRVSSPIGEIERNIKINRNIHSGFIHIPVAYNSNDSRRLLNLEPLLDAGSTGWDSCQVTIAKAAEKTMETTTEEAP